MRYLIPLLLLPAVSLADSYKDALGNAAFVMEVGCQAPNSKETLCHVYQESEDSMLLVVFAPTTDQYKDCPKGFGPVAVKRVKAGNPVQENVWVNRIYYQ